MVPKILKIQTNNDTMKLKMLVFFKTTKGINL